MPKSSADLVIWLWTVPDWWSTKPLTLQTIIIRGTEMKISSDDHNVYLLMTLDSKHWSHVALHTMRNGGQQSKNITDFKSRIYLYNNKYYNTNIT